MNVVVLVKQIPDPEQPAALDPDDHRLVRGTGLVIDDADRYGVEVALSLRDAAGEGEVVALAMTPAGETGGVRSALAMGVDRAVVVSDEALAGSDALGTAKVLGAAVAELAPDLVVAGTESTDGYTGTLPVQLAEVLGWPVISYATRVSCDGSLVRATRQTEAGSEEVECELPLVTSVTAGIVEPRYPSMRGIMTAKTKPLEVRDLAGLGVDPASVGAAGARQRIVEVSPAPPRPHGVVVTDDGTAHSRVVELLAELKVI